MRQTIDGAVYKRMILSAAASIEINKQQINDLNVFPVPDGDTGTNMSMTLNTAAVELRKQGDITLTKAADVTASALLRGARGNSGVILSLLFRGFSKSLKGKEETDGVGFAAALNAGVEAAYKAVMKPAEGTILTVSRLAGAGAEKAAEKDPCAEATLIRTIEVGKEALANTIEQNPVLKKAGVVDAGGMGFIAILEGMLAAMQDQDITAPESGTQASNSADFAALTDEDITFTFDTVFIVRKTSARSIEPFRAYLNSIGDSLVIGEDDEAFKVHVHTDIPGNALTEAQKYGTLELAKIENMRTQFEDMAAGRAPQSTDDLDAEEAAEPAVAEPEKKYGIVSVCAGSGLAAVFRDLGVDGIIEGGQTMNPSTEDILKQIDRTPAEIVYVLPNNKNIIMAAEQTIPLSKKKVIVIPSKTVPQGITALLNFDPEGEEETNTTAMTASLAGVTTMQITYAARNSDFDGRDIREGDYLGLYNGALLDTTPDVAQLLAQMAEKTAEDGKGFVNIFYGEDITEEQAMQAQAIFSEFCPDAEINLLSGGQPVYYYLISAE
ncbi:MAG: DAK2 domain-containing protein [Oscillospiraceae bacterium]|nr:DAK2 domain-containing protein [Oscillospiraceae bacterium]